MAGAAKEPGRDSSDRDSEAIKRRLDQLGERLESAKARTPEPRAGEPQDRGAALGQALRLATELIAGVLVGTFIGWWLDWLLGTAPWLLIIFLVLGAAAGILNVIRAAKAMQPKGPLPGPDLPDDDE